MNDFIESISKIKDVISQPIDELVKNPIFWIVLFAFCVLLFMNSKSKKTESTILKKFSNGIQKLISNLTDIFLDLFNSFFDVVNVVLNFLKEVSELLFGSLHEARAYKLAGFGVIFLSLVSFITTAKGLIAFIGKPYNLLVSFGVQSAILIVSFKIIKDYKQRREIINQIQKSRVDAQENTKDSFFRWKRILLERFKKCKKLSDQLVTVTEKNVESPESSRLLIKLRELQSFFNMANPILTLFGESVTVPKNGSDLKEIFDAMENAANLTADTDKINENRMNAVDQWLSERFDELINEIQIVLDNDKKARKEILPTLNKIIACFNNIPSNFVKWVKKSVPIFKEGKTWAQRISKKREFLNSIESLRYSSGNMKRFYNKWHFIRLGSILSVFIFLSSTFSYTFICGKTFKQKQEIENYHMTLKLCDDTVKEYQRHLLGISTYSKDIINGFIEFVKDTNDFDDSNAAYNKYYVDKTNFLRKQNQIDSSDSANEKAIYLKDFEAAQEEMEKSEKKKMLYENYLAFVEIFNQTSFAKETLAISKPEDLNLPNLTSGDTDASTYEDLLSKYISDLKLYDKKNAIYQNKDLVTLAEKIISDLNSSLEESEDELHVYRDTSLIYQNSIRSVELLKEYLQECNNIINNSNNQLVLINADDSNGTSKTLLNTQNLLLEKTTEFLNETILLFGSIPQNTVIDFCDSIFDYKSKINNQMRYIGDKTADVEIAIQMLFSPYISKGIPWFCWFIAVLIDCSIFIILFIRGIKNRGNRLEKLKVILANLLIKAIDEPEKTPLSPFVNAIIVFVALIAAFVLTFIVNIPTVDDNKGLFFFVFWFGLYLIIMVFARLILKKPKSLPDNIDVQRRKVSLVNDYYSHLCEALVYFDTDIDSQLDKSAEYQDLLAKECPDYVLHIADDFRMLNEKIEKSYFSSEDSIKKYVNHMNFNLLYKIYRDVLGKYVNDFCSDFLNSLTLDTAKEYEGYNYLFHRTLDKCQDSGQLFSVFYDSLYPTLLYIEYEEARKKGFNVMLNLLIEEDLAYLDDNRVYLAPLFFRIFNEILYLKMIDEEYDFNAVSDVDNDLIMDEIVDAYIESKYFNSDD